MNRIGPLSEATFMMPTIGPNDSILAERRNAMDAGETDCQHDPGSGGEAHPAPESGGASFLQIGSAR